MFISFSIASYRLLFSVPLLICFPMFNFITILTTSDSSILMTCPNRLSVFLLFCPLSKQYINYPFELVLYTIFSSYSTHLPHLSKHSNLRHIHYLIYRLIFKTIQHNRSQYTLVELTFSSHWNSLVQNTLRSFLLDLTILNPMFHIFVKATFFCKIDPKYLNLSTSPITLLLSIITRLIS